MSPSGRSIFENEIIPSVYFTPPPSLLFAGTADLFLCSFIISPWENAGFFVLTYCPWRVNEIDKNLQKTKPILGR